MADKPGGAPLNENDDVPLSRLPDKGRIVCRGRIESVTYVPADQTAAFSAIVTDADPRESGAGAAAGPGGRLRVVWLGRRRVPGIDAGTEVRLKGMLSRVDGLPTMFNPRYEILSRQENE
ncbi:single stranded DNA-binding domain-containing protein [Arthrobacter sp. D3-16]